MNRKFIIGIDLGGTNLKLAVLDLKYKLTDKEVLSTQQFRKKENLISAIVHSVNRIIENNKLKKRDILGIGLGLPGPIDEKSGIVHFFPNIPGWRGVNLKNILEKKLRLPVFLDNDAKLMALAEYRLGHAHAFKNALCLTLGTGVGGGVIIEGSLYRGEDNAAGEMGHVPINEKGPRCNCGGSACLETYIGNNRILNEAKKIFKRNISLEELSALAKKTRLPAGRQNKQALNIWLKVAGHLGIALVGVVNLLNLDAIIIGGGVANAGSILFDKVKQTVKKQAMKVQARRVKVFKAKLGSEAGLIGAAIMVKEKIK
jgi:glucokinase